MRFPGAPERERLRIPVAALLVALGAAASAPFALAQQSQPIGTQSEERRAARDRASTPGAKTDWEREEDARNFKEAEVAMPALPGQELLEFKVSAGTTFRFFIDPKSVAITPEGIVRYTLVARSPSGVDNVSYEGMRCGETGMVRVYGFARDGRWSANPTAEWKEIVPRTVQRWHSELRSRYFCPNRAVIVSVDEGLDALRRGGHPSVANLGAGGR